MTTASSCGARSLNGPCILPPGHNMGQVDIPEHHEGRESLWHSEGVQVGVFRAHSCLRCGALCVVGSAMKQHERWHKAAS